MSGCLEVNNAPIWLDAIDKVRSKGARLEISSAALRNMVHKGHDRIKTNRACIEDFFDTNGICCGQLAE